MDKTIACDISVARRELGYDPAVDAVRGDASQHPLVRRARNRAVTTSLVTGGSGYFGSLLVQRLVAGGDHVRVLDLSDATDRPADVEFVHGDIRDESVVAEAVAGCDVVFHNVAQVPLAKDPALLRTVNVDGTRIAAGRRQAGGRRQGRAHVVERGVRRT